MKKYIIPVLALALLCSCAKEEVTEQETPEQTQKEELAQEAEEFVPGSAIVQFDDDMIALIESDLAKGKVVTKSMALNEALDELGITSITRVFPDAGEFEPRSRAFGMHRFYYVKYNTDVTKTKAEETLEHLPGIVTFEPDRKIRTEDATLFNDPYYSNQWQYDNKGNQSGYKAGADIDVVPVWQNYTTGSPNVIVSEVDGGVDYTHEDLAWNVNVDSSYCFVDGYEGRTIYPHAHGTHVAGSIVAVNNNGIGVCGVAGGNYAAKKKGARLESCQIFMDNPAGGDDLGGNSAAAVKWGADHGAVISQNSWGYVYKTEEAAKSGGIGSAMKAAVDYFNTYAGYNSQGVQVGPMAGGIVIFAAGNDGYSIGWPAAYEGIMAVGAIGVGGTRASYSNYGDWVDIAAPGGSSSSTTIYSTEPGNKYGYMMGTSMACPHVSGVAALVVSACGGAGFTREMLWNKLIKGANSDFLKSSNEIGPLVDALGAVSYGSSATQNPVTTMTASTKSNNVIFNWKVNRDSENHPAYGYRLLASKDKAALAAADPANPASSVSFIDVLTGESAAGDAISGTLAGLDFSTQYYVAIAAFGYFRSFSKISVIETVTTGVNNPPVITTSYKGDFQIHSHETINFPFTITEPDGQTLTTSYVKGSDAESSYTDPTTGEFVVTVKGNVVDPGVYTAKLTASDPYGMSTVYNLKYTILENHAPVVVKKIGNMIMNTEGQKFTINMNQYIQDPDGEILTYTMSMSDKTVVHLNPQDSILYGTLLTYGMTTVTITASDARKASCQESFIVLGRDPDVSVQLYPNPVSTTLYVRTGNDETQTYVKVVAPTGAIVYEATSTASAFNPVEVDMSKCAPGSYSVTVKYDDISVSKTVVKI